jgi:pyrimidine-nucleoside phosphorylase
MEDRIDPSVGFVITAKPGDRVSRGDVLATVQALDESGLRDGVRTLSDAIRIEDGEPSPLPLISHRITADGIERWEKPAA